MTQISYANGDFLGPIPGYHSGVKYDYSDKDTGFGLAVVDSVYSGPYYIKGDGELKHNAGFEGYFVYKAIPGCHGLGRLRVRHQGQRHPQEATKFSPLTSGRATISRRTRRLALEYVHKDGGFGDKGYNWLAYYGYNFTPKVSSAFRVSGEKMKNGPGFTKFTVSPAYKVNDNFLVRTEVSYYDYTKHTADSALFFGLQSVFRF